MVSPFLLILKPPTGLSANVVLKKFAAQFGKSIGLTAAKVNPYSNYGATAAQMLLKAIANSDGSPSNRFPMVMRCGCSSSSTTSTA